MARSKSDFVRRSALWMLMGAELGDGLADAAVFGPSFGAVTVDPARREAVKATTTAMKTTGLRILPPL
jgi:hypothetical protein